VKDLMMIYLGIALLVLQLVTVAALALIYRRLTATSQAVVAVAHAAIVDKILPHVKGPGRQALERRLAEHRNRDLVAPSEALK